MTETKLTLADVLHDAERRGVLVQGTKAVRTPAEVIGRTPAAALAMRVYTDGYRVTDAASGLTVCTLISPAELERRELLAQRARLVDALGGLQDEWRALREQMRIDAAAALDPAIEAAKAELAQFDAAHPGLAHP